MKVESVVHILTSSREEESAVLLEFPSATWFNPCGPSPVCTFVFPYSDLEKVKRFVKEWKSRS